MEQECVLDSQDFRTVIAKIRENVVKCTTRSGIGRLLEERNDKLFREK